MNAQLYYISFGPNNSHYFVTDNLIGFLSTFEKNNIESFETFKVTKVSDRVIIDKQINL